MAEAASKGLPYGHFGQAAYDTESQQWRFTRRVGGSRTLQVLGGSEVIREPTATKPNSHEASRIRLPPSQKDAKQVRELLRTLPEVQPATGLFSPLLCVSEAIIDASAVRPLEHDNLLAIGLVPSELTHRRVELLAHPTGANGSDLFLATLSSQRRYWKGSKSTWLNLPIVTSEDATWSGPGVPIQQLCFAQPISHGDVFLAVRTPIETIIFRPVLRKHPLSCSTSALDSNLVCRIPIDREVGASHANVSFCPWRTSRLAVIDVEGSCVVRDIEPQRKRLGKQLCVFKVTQDIPGDVDNTCNDGWGRVTWVLGESFLLVANRKQICLFDIARNPERVLDLDAELKKDTSLVLDVQLIPARNDVACVLTTSRLLIFSFSGVEKGTPKAVCLLGWRHHISAELLDLRLSTFADGNDVALLLRSQTGTMQTTYQLTLGASGISYAFEPGTLETLAETPALTDVLIRPLDYGGKASSTEGEDRDRPRFLAALTLARDLAVRREFLASRESGTHSLVSMPGEKGLTKAGTSRLPKEHFVTDGDMDMENEAPLRPKPTSQYVQHRLLLASTASEPQWTISYRPTCQHLCQQPEDDAISFVEVISRAREQTTKQDASVDAFSTLQQLANSRIRLDDMNVAARSLKGFLESTPESAPSWTDVNEDQSTTIAVKPVKFPANMYEVFKNRELTSIYDRMIRQYVSTLSRGIPGRTRLAKDETARQIAADVVLSSHILRPSAPYAQGEPHQSQSQAESWELPMRASSQMFPDSQMSELPTSQTALPTPSPTATPSVTTASYPASIVAPEVSRLSRYTTFNGPTPPALPKALNRVLAHWPPGTDPANYDWLSTYRRLEQPSESVDEDMTEKERARLQRRAERHIRRQRREAKVSEQQHIASSQAPRVAPSQSQGLSQKPPPMMGSQPAAVLASSQSVGAGQIPAASQVERGKFGGKPPKKKRKQGF
ncbi:hypothetical protein MBLNU230_g1116t1 [Neophaeotheca triangularis]